MGLASTIPLCFASTISICSRSSRNDLFFTREHVSHRHRRFRSTPKSAYSSQLFTSSRHRTLIDGRCFSSKDSVGQIKVEEDIINDDEACELVNGIEILIGEGDDSINAQLFTAVKNNNGTGILLLSDIFGFQDSYTKDFAYRIACNGYNVLVPDLFRGDPWTRERPKVIFEEWISSQEHERVAKDISSSTKWLVDELKAAGISKKLGIIGFCFGGGKLVDVLARDKGDYFGTGISFYGTSIDSSQVANINVPILFMTGDKDPLCSVDELKKLETGIGKGSKLVVFEGRGHGFGHRPQSSEDDRDAEQAFALLRNWLQNGLLVNS